MLQNIYLRARQVHGLYDWVDADSDPFTTDRPERLVEAKQALDDATEVVLRREANYRMPLSRLQAGVPIQLLTIIPSVDRT